MDDLRRLRGPIRAVITKRATEITTLLDDAQPDDIEIKSNLSILEGKQIELCALNKQIYAAMEVDPQQSEEAFVKEILECEEYEKKILKLKFRYERVMAQCLDVAPPSSSRAPSLEGSEHSLTSANGNSASRSGVSVHRDQRKFKLPRIEFIKFDGDAKQWLPFWSQFEKVHLDDDIDEADKVQYLIQATTSKARRLVESYPAVGTNYAKIIEALQGRFGREDLQIEIHIRELLKLILNTHASGQVEVASLYDSLESHMRALETMGVTTEKCAAILFPLIESCLPEGLLRQWQRSNEFVSHSISTGINSLENRLTGLMKFLKGEVENEQRIAMAQEGFGVRSSAGKPKKMDGNSQRGSRPAIPTAAILLGQQTSACIFCKGSHETSSCSRANKMTVEEKQKLLADSKSCFRCFKVGHSSRFCRAKVRCLVCDKGHATVMCIRLGQPPATPPNENPPLQQNFAKQSTSHVFLQTLRVCIVNGARNKVVRALLDSGSQGSYVLSATAKELNLVSSGTEYLAHALFGGAVTKPKPHDHYKIKLRHLNYHLEIDVMGQATICQDIPPVFEGSWSHELKGLGISVSDEGGSEPIELLLGADVLGRIITGRKCDLECGLVAQETCFGWTLMGKTVVSNHACKADSTMVFQSLLQTCSISDLWDLEVLGIEDPGKRVTKEEAAQEAKEMFQNTVCRNKEGRYEVSLPWLTEHPVLPTNRNLAKKRLQSTLKRLEKLRLFKEYDLVLAEWLNEGVIEKVVDTGDVGVSHYLPHRPVVKEGSSTTKIRPVFDASAREKGAPSLNHCLEKGANLIEQIPTILIKFRLFRVGVVADVRKAFLQIAIKKRDRDVLRFLWIDDHGEVVVYRHRRVVFGVNCSPFLLGATVAHHLEGCRGSDMPFREEVINRLLESFYVDNCVTSFEDSKAVSEFAAEAQLVMADGKFDLRAWEWSGQTGNGDPDTPLLGLTWNKAEDVLRINARCVVFEPQTDVTKRNILSVTQRVFDPIGFTSPVMLRPKLLLQQLWGAGVGWDTPVNEEYRRQFLDWQSQLSMLSEVTIPRWINAETGASYTLHTFCDASLVAYAAVVFLRVEKDDRVMVHLLQAKSRVSPENRKLTIPRLELMAALIGSRLYSAVKSCLKFEAEPYFWSDSTTSLAWIQRLEEWAPFVGNRVREIRSLTKVDQWRHVPGKDNPADLPSRGCDTRALCESRWWEGPSWLLSSEGAWPTRNEGFQEAEIVIEKKKRIVSSMVNAVTNLGLNSFGKFSLSVRVVGWIFRFKENAMNKGEKIVGELSCKEIESAERCIWTIVQKETFQGVSDARLGILVPVLDGELIRVKTRLVNREDTFDFRMPIVLPGEHLLVRRMVFEEHVRCCHIGAQGLMSKLRERYWILGGRRAIKKAISSCIVCRRYLARRCEAEEAPLPRDRVRDAVPFEVTGVDFAGPLFLKGGNKVWICLFTCAVYRAVHLELCQSLSSVTFLQALRRFIARRGRPVKIFSDNGTNFVGVSNVLKQLDWDVVMKYATTQRIEWSFNPPSAPWWGGFWERLIGVLKPLLRKVLARACLKYEELLTVICDCEAVLNDRPLTHVSSNPGEPEALTPNCFLRYSPGIGVVDLDLADQECLTRRAAHQQQLRDDLRNCFRSEYLGQLELLQRKQCANQLKVRDVVLIGDNCKKRIDWPLARIEKLIPGKDGVVRVVKLRINGGLLTRPVQRIFRLDRDDNASAGNEVLRLECGGVDGLLSDRTSPMCVESAGSESATRRGRVVRKPLRFR